MLRRESLSIGLDPSTSLRPFAISANPDHHIAYKSQLRSLHELNIRRVNRMFGYEVIIFRRHRRARLHARLHERIKRFLRAKLSRRTHQSHPA